MLETYQKQQEINENPEGKKPAWEPSLKEILSKSEDSDLFGELLTYSNQDALAEKLAKGELGQSDLEDLDNYRKEFVTRKERANVVKESISEDMIKAYTKNNPELQKLVSLIGPKEYGDIIKGRITKMAMNDHWTFDFLASTAEDQKRFRSDYINPLDKELEELCKQKKISPEKCMKALATEDPEERRKQLRSAVREGYGDFKKVVDWISGGAWSKKRVELMNSKKEEVDITLAQLRVHQSNMGELLSGLVGNDDVRESFAKNLVGEKIENEQKIGFREAKGKVPTEEKFQADWSAYKEKVKWDEVQDITEREALKESFLQKQKEALSQEKKGGFWSTIFSLFINSFIEKNKNNLN